MADLILHKRSSTASAVPSAGSIALGELAINTADGRLFLKKGDGTVVDVTSIGGIQGLTAALAGKMTNPMTTAGDMIRGGASGAPERVAAGTNGYVWSMVSGVPGWAAPAGVAPYESSPQVITQGGSLTLTHGLGSTPTLWIMLLQCVEADLGFSVGDLVQVPGTQDAAAHCGVTVVPSSTSLFCRFGTSARSFFLLRKDTGTIYDLTAGRWRFILRAWP